MIVLLRARRMLADWHHQHQNYAAAGGLYGSILACDPEAADLPDVVYPLATSLLAMGRAAEAEPLLERTVRIGAPPRMEAGALAYLGEIRRTRGDSAGAKAFFDRALAIPGLDEAFRNEILRRSGSR
jgi:hypothetical protein